MTEETVSPEDKLAAAFERAGMKDEAPQPEPEDDEPAEVEAESVESEADAEDGGETAEAEGSDAAADDSAEAEEIEYEGKSYKLPKELKEALLRQQDYTRKTQEVADRRRMIDQQAQALELRQQFNATHAEKVAHVQALNAQIQQFGQVDWAELANSNPAQYLQLDRQHRMLQEAAGKLGGEVQQLAMKFDADMAEQRRKAQALCVEELKREFKDFGPEMIRSLDEAGRSFGFTGDELAQIVDPRVIRVLHAAAQYTKLRTAKPIAEKRVPNVEARPMAVKGARTANQSLQSAKLTAAKEQLRKTGKASDAEAFLTARFAKAMQR